MDKPTTSTSKVFELITRNEVHTLRKHLESQSSNETKSVNEPNEKGETPLLYSLKNSNEECAIVLLDHGADANKSSKDGSFPIHVASRLGFDKVVAKLITKGSSINQKDEDQNEPIHLAANGGNVEIIQLLLDAGANIEGNYIFKYFVYNFISQRTLQLYSVGLRRRERTTRVL
jgi:ankyrin repeat protein